MVFAHTLHCINVLHFDAWSFCSQSNYSTLTQMCCWLLRTNAGKMRSKGMLRATQYSVRFHLLFVCYVLSLLLCMLIITKAQKSCVHLRDLSGPVSCDEGRKMSSDSVSVTNEINVDICVHALAILYPLWWCKIILSSMPLHYNHHVCIFQILQNSHCWMFIYCSISNMLHFTDVKWDNISKVAFFYTIMLFHWK